MAEVSGSESRPDDAAATTLGDLLFGSSSQQRHVAESEWTTLVQRVAEGDPHALHSLYGRMHRMVFTMTFRMTHSRETAEELTLDVFHDVWRRASSYGPAGGSVAGWIMSMARSRAIDRLRFEQRKKRSATPGVLIDDTASSNDADALIAAQQERRRVREALEVLTPDERQAIEAAFFSELTYSQVATRLNTPVGTVKSRIRIGLAKLRRALAGTVDSSP